MPRPTLETVWTEHTYQRTAERTDTIEQLAQKIEYETKSFLEIAKRLTDKKNIGESDLDRYLCNQLLEKINHIQLNIDDPVYKEFLMYGLAKNSGYNLKQLNNLFYKSLISSENEKSLTIDLNLCLE